MKHLLPLALCAALLPACGIRPPRADAPDAYVGRFNRAPTQVYQPVPGIGCAACAQEQQWRELQRTTTCRRQGNGDYVCR